MTHLIHESSEEGCYFGVTGDGEVFDLILVEGRVTRVEWPGPDSGSADVNEDLADGAGFDRVVGVSGSFQGEPDHGQPGARTDRERSIGDGRTDGRDGCVLGFRGRGVDQHELESRVP